jgi:hypothetical protein
MATGRLRLGVELYGMENVVLRKSELEQVTFIGGAQLNMQEVCIQMTLAPFARPGFYEFRLIANHAHLEDGGTSLLRVLPG